MNRIPKVLTATALAGALTFGVTPTAPTPEANAQAQSGIGIAALAAVLVIGGVTWYLAKDGITYIRDQSRTHLEPTPEEKAASQEMIKNDKEEVIAQSGAIEETAPEQAPVETPVEAEAPAAVEAPRGMAAETGSNTVARLLAALSIAAMMLGGVFTARRRFYA